MKIPNKVMIGEYYYSVKQVQLIDWDRSIGGQINYNTKTIKLKPGVDKKITESTFFHEIAHGLLKELEYNHPKITAFRSNETFVEEMGLQLRKTFVDLLNGGRER